MGRRPSGPTRAVKVLSMSCPTPGRQAEPETEPLYPVYPPAPQPPTGSQPSGYPVEPGAHRGRLLQLLLSALSIGILSPLVSIWALIEGILIFTRSPSFATDPRGIPLRD